MPEARYVEPALPLDPAFRDSIVCDLNNRRAATFRHAEAQDKFLLGVAAALSEFRRPRCGPLPSRRTRLKQAERVQLAARELSTAVKCLEDDDVDILLDLVWQNTSPRPAAPSKRDELDAALQALAAGARDLTGALRQGHGEGEQVPGANKLLAARIADAWRECFGVPARPSGAFAEVLAPIFTYIGVNGLGRAVLKNIIAPKRG